jgi:hypothetical protein
MPVTSTNLVPAADSLVVGLAKLSAFGWVLALNVLGY